MKWVPLIIPEPDHRPSDAKTCIVLGKEVTVLADPRITVRVLIVHNAYQQAGGEDAVVSAEKALLLRAGNEVNQYLRHNNEIKSGSSCSNITGLSDGLVLWRSQRIASA